MLPQTPPYPRKGLILGVFLLLGLTGGTSVSAQELRLERYYPGTGPFECPAPRTPAAPTEDQRVRASQLTSDALQASILGDLESARALLAQAATADPTSPEVAYRHGRALEDVEFRDEAILEYCRAIALGARDVGILDSRSRLDVLYEVVRERITDRARTAFVAGLNQADGALYENAANSFSVALDEVPDWAEAVYNRALVLERLGRVQESLSDYRLYLALTPNEVDPLVALVSERIGALEGSVTIPTPSPTAALALGVVPGMGHYYTGRGLGGTAILTLAGAAVAAGLLVQDITVVCLNTPPSGASCPPGEIVEEIKDRPYLTPAMGVAAAVTLAGAVEAFLRARGRRAEQAEQAEAVQSLTSTGLRISGPSVASRRGRVDVSLLGLRFR